MINILTIILGIAIIGVAYMDLTSTALFWTLEVFGLLAIIIGAIQMYSLSEEKSSMARSEQREQTHH